MAARLALCALLHPAAAATGACDQQLMQVLDVSSASLVEQGHAPAPPPAIKNISGGGAEKHVDRKKSVAVVHGELVLAGRCTGPSEQATDVYPIYPRSTSNHPDCINCAYSDLTCDLCTCEYLCKNFDTSCTAYTSTSTQCLVHHFNGAATADGRAGETCRIMTNGGWKDPHLVAVGGEKFDVNQPGEYTLVRAPGDRSLPPKLELNVSIGAADSDSPCGLYIHEVQLGGALLGGSAVTVRSLQRNAPGSNGAGNATLRPFSMKVGGGARGAARGEGEGSYQPWSNRSVRVSPQLVVEPAWRQPMADAGMLREAEAFRFVVQSGDAAGLDTVVEVSQGSHQALDVEINGLRALGAEQLGGLLGTGGHDKRIEQVTLACAAFQARNKDQSKAVIDRASSRRYSPSWDARGGSSMSAHWDMSS